MVRVGADTETHFICSACGKRAVLREITMAHNGIQQKVSYETHCESIVDPEHIAAQLRATSFYEKIADLVAGFKALSEKERIVMVENPTAAGLLTNLEFGSVRPAACQVRTIAIPYFTMKSFAKEYEIPLDPRELNGLTLGQLMEEINEKAKGYVKEARDKTLLGLG